MRSDKEEQKRRIVAHRKRLERLARVLRMTPPKEGRGLRLSQDHDKKWWLCGCTEGDAVIPGAKGEPTEYAALEAGEAWLAVPLERLLRK